MRPCGRRTKRAAIEARWALAVLALVLLAFVGSVSWFTGVAVYTASETPPDPSEAAASRLRHGRGGLLPCPDCENDRELVLCDPPMYGDDVRELQQRLRVLGHYQGEITGSFDAATCESLKVFQTSQNMEATGIVTHDLWYALGPNVAATPSQPAEPSNKPQGVVSIVVDTRKLTLTVMDDGQPFRKFPCAIGKPSTPTPIGEFMVRNKWMEPGGPFGSRWMGLNIPWGTYGIHGTNRPYSIGTMASAGCIRMFNQHVSELYPWVPIGAHVTIIGPQPVAAVSRALSQGHTGMDVQYLQYKVRQAGFNPGMVDGRFGSELRDALTEIQRFYGLPVTGKAGPNEFHILGIK